MQAKEPKTTPPLPPSTNASGSQRVIRKPLPALKYKLSPPPTPRPKRKRIPSPPPTPPPEPKYISSPPPTQGSVYFENFFADYEFDYDPSQPIMGEFYRMSKSYKWEKDSKEVTEARDRVRNAIAETFNDTYGKDVNDLSAWHNLCRAVRIDPLPEDIQSCREVSRWLHIQRIFITAARS